MTPSDLSAAIAALFGGHKGALADAARALPVNYDNLRQMLSGRRPVPAWIAVRIERLRALASIASPADGSGPGDCATALRPHLDDLSDRAIRAGWPADHVRGAVADWKRSKP